MLNSEDFKPIQKKRRMEKGLSGMPFWKLQAGKIASLTIFEPIKPLFKQNCAKLNLSLQKQPTLDETSCGLGENL